MKSLYVFFDKLTSNNNLTGIFLASAVFLVLLSGQTIHCGTLVRTEAQLPPAKTTPVNWAEVISAQSGVRLKSLFTGTVTVPPEGMLDSDDPGSHTYHNRHKNGVTVNVYAHLIHHPVHGDWLIDTGLDESYQKDGNIDGFLADNYILSHSQQKGHDLAAQLTAQKPELRGVLFTHLHGDHTAGAPALADLFPQIKYYAGSGDEYHDIPLLYSRNHLQHVSRLHSINTRHGQPAPIFGHAVDFFEDGTLWALPTPGHSSGHLSYLVITENKPVLLTGDASHTAFGFEQDIIPGWHEDAELARKSLKRLRNFVKQYTEIQVIFGHEMKDSQSVRMAMHKN